MLIIMVNPLDRNYRRDIRKMALLGGKSPSSRTDVGFLAVLVIHLVPAVAGSRCANAHPSSANGCSVPLRLPFFYKQRFTPACNRHDMCYGCGSHFGLSRNDCDHAFLHDMLFSCGPVTPAARARRHVDLSHSGLLPSGLFRAHDARRKSLESLKSSSLRIGHSKVVTDALKSKRKPALAQKKEGYQDREPNSKKLELASDLHKDSLRMLQDFLHRASAFRKRMKHLRQKTASRINKGHVHVHHMRRIRSARRKRESGWCRTFAQVAYFPAVQLFGQTHYSEKGQTGSHCAHSWVSSCLHLVPSHRTHHNPPVPPPPLPARPLSHPSYPSPPAPPSFPFNPSTST